MPTTLTPEQADQIATDHLGPVLPRFTGGAYRVARVAELPELQKFYYLPQWHLDRERTLEDSLRLPIGSGGFFVSLSTGEIEEIGSGAILCASAYLRIHHHLPPDAEPSLQELAELLARHSSDMLFTMLQEERRT